MKPFICLLGRILLATALLAATASLAAASEIKVIVNSGVGISEISLDDLRSIFLLSKKSFADGTHAEPVLSKSAAAHAAFLKRYLGKSEDSLTTYYRNAVFTGKGLTPRSLATDSEVAAYVARTKGAIGYVSGDASDAGAKTIQVK